MKVGRVYRRLYATVAGRLPEERPWHFHWLPGPYAFGEDLKRVLAPLEGRVLDVGCRDKPYRAWVPGAQEWFGIDVEPGPAVDMLIGPDTRWDLPDNYFDVVLCAQVQPMLVDPDLTLDEMARVLKPGGTLVLTTVVINNEAGTPHDYQRLTRWGTRVWLSKRFEVVEITARGAVGSSLGLLLLNWIDASMNRNGALVLILMLLLPLWLLVSGLVNAIAWALDRVDRTGLFYNNLIAIARKPQSNLASQVP